MSDLRTLVREKSARLIELQELAATKPGRSVIELASEVAALEGRIVEMHLRKRRYDEATINLVSQASCLQRARRTDEAFRVLNKAASYAKGEPLKQWISTELAKIEAHRKPAEVFQLAHPKIQGNPKLRRPQIQAYEAAVQHFSRSRRHAIIQLPVGCGKTGTMSLLPFGIAAGRVLVVAPNLEIRTNLARRLDYSQTDCFLRQTSVLRNGQGPMAAQLDSEANLLDCDQSDIVITNIQQLVAADSSKWLSKLSPDYFDMILLDEGHHNVAPTWKEVIGRFSAAKITSFTATPLRSDGQKVEGTRIYRFPIADAIKEGYVKDIASRKLEPSEIHFTYKGERRKHSLEEILKLRDETWFSKGVALAPECNRHIVDASIQCLNELREGSSVKHQIIASACSIDHARSIRALYAERNLRAEVIHSKLEVDEQSRIKALLSTGQLDVIVQVQMLGEGADYPTLGVAAIFRPYRHMVPYVQFVGRVMRVVVQASPGHRDNRGFVVSHVGLNIDRWWRELRDLDNDDQLFFEEIANGERTFLTEPTDEGMEQRRRFQTDMQVIEEHITHLIQERFLPEDTKAMVDDLIKSMLLRGIDVVELGLNREVLEKRLLAAHKASATRVNIESLPVTPQKARQQARQRLDERVRSGAKRLLAELKFSVVGIDLPKLFPRAGTFNNLASAIVLLNSEVTEYLGVSSDERDLLATQQLRRAHDNMDLLIDRVVKKVQDRRI